jgi:hypothetical protein
MRLASKALMTAISAVLCVAPFTLAGAAGPEADAKPAIANPAVLKAQILARWQPVAEAAGAHYAAWADVFGTQLSLMSVTELQRIDAVKAAAGSSAKANYKRFTQAFLDAQATRVMSASSDKTELKLASITTDQVFVPLVPCRIVDTRNVGGPIAASTQRLFYFYTDTGGYSWSNQGGVAGAASTSCPGTVDPGSGFDNGPAAAVATVTAVGPTAAGNFVVWGGGGTFPQSSALNFTVGQTLANTTVIPWGGRTGGALDFAVRYNGPSGQADVVVDVIGYFIENHATALECVTTTSSAPFLGIVIASCGAGYTLTGGGCQSSSTFDHTYANYPSNSTDFTCAFWPETGHSLGGTLTASARCCRVPGQ